MTPQHMNPLRIFTWSTKVEEEDESEDEGENKGKNEAVSSLTLNQVFLLDHPVFLNQVIILLD